MFALIGGVVIAAAAVFAKSGGGKPAAAAPAAAIAGPALVTAPVETPKPQQHDLTLQLDKLTKTGDHYEAPLADGRVAVLTLDPVLQDAAEKLLDEARAPRGAIVAMAPDGRILALAGRRTAEPKGGKDGISDWHLATDVWAPAASIFKLVTASALVAGGLDPDEKVAYHGGLRSVVDSNLKDDRRDNNEASLTFGVAHSNNAIVGKLAYQHLEPGALDAAAHDLGLAADLPMSLALTGRFAELTLPHDKTLDFARAAAGFEGSRLSVLGGALLASAFADQGEEPVPRIIESIGGVKQDAPAKHRAIAQTVAAAVAKMMVATCDFGSAARSFRHHKVEVAGKTGTLATTEPFYMEHSWFVGYAPVDKPQIIVSVLLGNPENWHLRGHQAAKRMIDLAVKEASPESARRAGNPVR
ncbi:MAG TPA: penicillin-binding transpeptidase domain-containing protein [Kofleriaceae bacterium]|jgi:cell division protein FtsI/penicillin-binding protein 2